LAAYSAYLTNSKWGDYRLIRAREKRAGGPISREERSKNREPGTLLGSGLSSVSINAAALLLRIGQREKPLYGRLPQEGS
jgi:hypothetical protein